MTPDTDPAAAPPPPAPAPTNRSTRQLRRRSDDRILGGVASGIADYFDIDPVLVRIGFVVLTVAGGSGILAYLVMWLITPEDRTGKAVMDVSSGQDREGRGFAFFAGVALIAIATLTLIDRIDVFDGSIVWPLLLIGAGVMLFRSDDGVPAPTSKADTSAADATEAEGAGGALPPPPAASGLTPALPPTPREARQGSVLGRLTIGVAALWVGISALVAQTTSADISAGVVAGVALAIVGAGLLVGTFIGRARWLIGVGFLLIPIVAVASLIDAFEVSWRAGWGETRVVIQDGQTDQTVEHFAGELEIDLTRLDAGDDFDLIADLGMGEMRITIPADANVTLHASGVGGELTGDGVRTVDGIDWDTDQVLTGSENGPDISIDASVGFGVIQIEREEAR